MSEQTNEMNVKNIEYEYVYRNEPEEVSYSVMTFY